MAEDVMMKTGSSFSTILQSNKHETARIEQFRNEKISTKPRNLVFGGLVVAGVFTIGLFALQIITGVLALVVTGAACVGAWWGLGFVKKMDPLIRQKTKNMQIKWMVEEARKNAISQLENQVIDNAGRLSVARDARDKMGAAIETMKSSLDSSKSDNPMHTRKLEMVARVQKAYDIMCDNLDKGAVANQQFKTKVAEYKEMERLSQMAVSAMSFFDSGSAAELSNMLSLEAFGQIESDFNEAIVNIENSANDMALDHQA